MTEYDDNPKVSYISYKNDDVLISLMMMEQ